MKGKLQVCRVEYETKDMTNWKANILAYSMEDAIEYIRKNVRDFNRYISTSNIGDVDAIEDKAFKDFFVNETIIVESVVNDGDSSDDDSGVVCPWCAKEFKNNNTLGNHIKKFHIK